MDVPPKKGDAIWLEWYSNPTLQISSGSWTVPRCPKGYPPSARLLGQQPSYDFGMTANWSHVQCRRATQHLLECLVWMLCKSMGWDRMEQTLANTLHILLQWSKTVVPVLIAYHCHCNIWRSDLIYRAMLLLYIRSASQKPSNSFNVPTLRSDV